MVTLSPMLGTPDQLPSEPVGDVPSSQQLHQTHARPGWPGQGKIGQAWQLAAPVSDREAGGELHARLSIASPRAQPAGGR